LATSAYSKSPSPASRLLRNRGQHTSPVGAGLPAMAISRAQPNPPAAPRTTIADGLLLQQHPRLHPLSRPPPLPRPRWPKPGGPTMACPLQPPLTRQPRTCATYRVLESGATHEH
jgi:hypothetical protein